VGSIKGVDSIEEFSGYGFAVSGFLAAGPKGIAGQYVSSLSIKDLEPKYHGGGVGYATGAGASASIVGVVTSYDRSYEFGEAPAEVGPFLPGGQ
jgi:hypothetical protein